jgi:glycosyltransferase involved in cell wall biosynthesis
MKIRVLHVIDHLGYGGAPLVVKRLVEAMPAERIESVVCALRPNPKSIDIGAKVVTLDCHKYSPGVLRAVPRLAAEHKIDIVHAHLQKAVMSTLLAEQRLGRPLIVHEHGPIFRGGTGFIYRAVLKHWGARARAVIANSQAAAQAMKRVLGQADVPIEVVANSIDAKRFDPSRYDGTAARQALGLGDDELAVGFVGRLDRAKGADLLVDAAALLRDRGCRFRAIFVGDGAEREALQQQIRRLDLEKHVVLAGLRENPAEVMAALDVAVVPSRREAFGVAAVELMAMGVPIVATAVGGLPELIEDGRTGLLVPPGAVAEMAQAVQRLEADEGLRDSIRQAALVKARAFSGAEQARQVEQLYRKVIT